LEILATGHDGHERRLKQRRIGAGRRVFRDRRVQERRFDVWSGPGADEQRCNPDRRKTGRRLESRRKYPNRRVAGTPVNAWEIEVASEASPS
jgi:hypothetical protein